MSAPKNTSCPNRTSIPPSLLPLRLLAVAGPSRKSGDEADVIQGDAEETGLLTLEKRSPEGLQLPNGASQIGWNQTPKGAPQKVSGQELL